LLVISVDVDATVQILVIYCAVVKYFKTKWEYNKTVHQLFIDLRKAYDSVRRDVLCNIVIEFGSP